MIFRSDRRVAGVGLSLLLLAGCNGSQPQSTALLPTTGTSSTRSAFRAGATTPDLLYVANRKDASIGMYELATGKLHGRLSNVHASGMCANADGTVFVANGRNVDEYAHGG